MYIPVLGLAVCHTLLLDQAHQEVGVSFRTAKSLAASTILFLIRRPLLLPLSPLMWQRLSGLYSDEAIVAVASSVRG